MFRLRTLGQVDLRDDEGREVEAILVQPKRLALLVYLAHATAAGFQRRDLLLPVFWPELPEARARNALRQAVHHLRRALDDDVILSRGADALAVNEARLWCDARAFEGALARGALDEAVTLYEGDLLPGFAVGGAAEFDRWLDDRRAFLRNRATRAAWALADRHERAGDTAAATECARRAASLGIDDEAGLRQLVALLDRVGEGAAALDAYTEYVRRRRREGDDEPTSATTALVEAIRARQRDGADAKPASSHGAVRDERRVTITPFRNLTGDPAFDYVGRLVCDAVAQSMVESRAVTVVTTDVPGDVADARADGGFLVTGSYFLIDESWRFQALVGEPGGHVLDTIRDVAAPRLQPWEAADELGRRLGGMLAGRLDRRFASWAGAVVQAPDLEAHRELAVGVDLHLRGDFRAAIPHLLRAGDTGEGFTLPVLWAVQASCNLREWEQAEAILAGLGARSRQRRLSAFEQLGCDYYAASLDGRRGEALRLARMAAELLPGSEVLSQVGREAIFCNQPRVAIDALERLDAERGWIPSWTPHWRRLTEAYHMLGDHAREMDAARRSRLHHPEAVSALLYEARAHAALGDVAAVDRCVDDACAFPSDRFADAGDVMLEAARELRTHGRPAEGLRLAERAIGWHDEQPRDARNGHALACACYEAGRWEDAEAVLRELAAASPDDVDIIGLTGVVTARTGDDAAARSAIATLRAKTGRFRFGAQFVWIARVLAILGDHEAAVVALRAGFARGYCHGIGLHADADLALLGALPSFRELMRPR